MNYLESTTTESKEHKHSTWICFSDADDLWHPDRILFYVEMIIGVKDDKSIITIRADRHLEGATTQTGTIKQRTQGTLEEHWNLCVRMPLVQWFLSACHPETKAHHYCDVLFSQWVCTLATTAGTSFKYVYQATPSIGGWLYFYRIHKHSILASTSSYSKDENYKNNVDITLALYAGLPIKTSMLAHHKKYESEPIALKSKRAANAWSIYSSKSVFRPEMVAPLFPLRNPISATYLENKEHMKCSWCTITNCDTQCSKCDTPYCNLEHHRLDWPKHKAVCNTLIALEPLWRYETESKK
jgi:hypothetical protein